MVVQNKTPQRHGFVLLLTLVLIGIAGLVMVGIARHSLSLALDAVAAQEDLQRRWAMISAQRAVLDRAEDLLKQQEAVVLAASAEDNRQWQPVRQISGTARIGGLSVSLVVADEHAKLNLNLIQQERGNARSEQLARRLAKNRNLRVRWRQPGKANQDHQPRIDAWGQVFDWNAAGAYQPRPPAEQLLQSTAQLTLWGPSSLNLLRASDEAVREVSLLAQLREDDISRLLELRAANPAMSVEDLLDELRLRESQLDQLGELFTDRSQCHSLWIKLDDGRRSWYCFEVQESAEELSRRFSFAW